jgi:hypothetical protein
MPDHIPIKRWGKDHWSTFAYLETRCVDHDGDIDRHHLRVDALRHPGLGHCVWSTDYPTRLKGGDTITPHDDVDCIEDMVAAGLVEWGGSGVNPSISLTALGLMVANALRNHKASGGSFGSFEYVVPGFVEEEANAPENH